MFDTLIIIAIIIMIGVVLVALIKAEKINPVVICLLCLVWFFSGVFMAYTAYDYYSTYSTVNGTMEEHIPYEDFNYYEYNLSREIAWYYDNETGTYYYETNYATSMEFDGSENNYTLLINDSPCDETISANARLQGSKNIYFNDVDGNYKDTIKIKVEFTFYASNIKLVVSTSATNENIGLLNEYVKVNSFDLRIIEKIYNSTPLLTDEAV